MMWDTSKLESVNDALRLLIEVFRKDSSLLICGNGGSASDSQHIVGELQKSFLLPRTLVDDDKKMFDLTDEDYKLLSSKLAYGLKAYSLTSESSLLSAISNDVGGDYIYAQQVFATGRRGDCLLCISTSGNSRNVVLAAKTAKAIGMKVISLTGSRDSKLSAISDVCIKAPATETYEIQDHHIKIYHYLCMAIEREFFQ